MLVVAAVAVSLTSALSCASECNEEDVAKCKPQEPSEMDCFPRGRQTRPCHCCMTCANDVGEQCGGLWGHYGRCGKNLSCEVEAGVEWDENGPSYNKDGTCVSKQSQ